MDIPLPSALLDSSFPRTRESRFVRRISLDTRGFYKREGKDMELIFVRGAAGRPMRTFAMRWKKSMGGYYVAETI